MNEVQRIGIPRSIFHYEYRGIFQRFFECLGFDVVLSLPTNRTVFQLGKEKIIDELCFPLKVYAGHVLSLAAAGVRPIFIPVITGSDNDRSFLCHYQIHMQDIVRNLQLVPEEEVLTGVFNFDRNGFLEDGFYQVGRDLGVGPERVNRALAAVRRSEAMTNHPGNPPSDVAIGLLGREYLTQDGWASMDVAQILSARRVIILTERDFQDLNFYPDDVPAHFTMSARTLDIARRMNLREDIAGIIFLLPFNCGPDSDIAHQLVAEASKPFLTLVIDELASREGLTTRLEAFMDLLQLETTA